MNNAKPPRIEVLPWNLSGLQANPARGLMRWEVFCQIDPSPADANVSPPGTAKLPAGICEIGLDAYAAIAAAATGLALVTLNPFTVRPSFSEYGVSWSKRTPRFSVRSRETRQSS